MWSCHTRMDSLASCFLKLQSFGCYLHGFLLYPLALLFIVLIRGPDAPYIDSFKNPNIRVYQELSFPLLPIVPNLVKAYLSFLYTKQSPQLFKKVIWHLRGDTSNMLTSRKVLTYQNYGSAFLCPWRTLLWTVTMPNTSGPCFASQHSGAARNKGLPPCSAENRW